MKRRVLFPLLILLMLLCLATPALAAEDTQKESVMDALFGALPDAVRDTVGNDPDTLYETYDVGYYIRFLFEEMREKKSAFLSLLSASFSILLIFSALPLVGKNTGRTLSPLLSATMALLLYRLSGDIFSVTAQYLTDIAAFGRLLLPIMGGLYAAGGNTATAVASSASFAIFLSVLEILAEDLLLPLVRILFSLTAVSAIGGDRLSISAVSGFIRRTYITIVLFFSMLFGIVLSGQSMLSSAGDGAAFHALRFAVGNMIPIVGGTVSSALGTLSASVGYLRSAVGGVAVTAILLLALPLIMRLLLMRFALVLSKTAAELAVGGEVKTVISDFIGIYDALTATVALSSVSFLLSVTLFAKCAVLL